MEKPSFASQVVMARENTQQAIEHLNYALEMFEGKTLAYKDRQQLRKTRQSLKRNLTALRKFLLSVDAIYHPDQSLPGFNAKPSASSQDSQEITKGDNTSSGDSS
ncbi:hypothetical protein ES705_19297 [subsurface metagenome]